MPASTMFRLAIKPNMIPTNIDAVEITSSSVVNFVRPRRASICEPMKKKNAIERKFWKVGAPANGQLTTRQSSPARMLSVTNEKLPVAAVLTALAIVDMAATPVTSTVVVTSTLPTLNHGSCDSPSPNA